MHFENRNIHPDFDGRINEWLSLYVYVLCDQHGRPFYVGKGGGNDGQGNTRLLNHFEEARRISPDDPKRSAKVRKIHEIWKDGNVQWYILRRHISDAAAAFEIECAAIDVLRASGHDLTNSQGGHYSGRLGLIATPEDLYAQAARPFALPNDPDLCDRPICLFNIGNVAKTNGGDFEAATREAWVVGRQLRDQHHALDPSRRPIAIGLCDGIARSAMIIDQWECTDPRVAASKQRWRIVSTQELGAEQTSQLIYRNFREIVQPASGYFGYGNWISFSMDKAGQVTYLRGVDQPAAT